MAEPTPAAKAANASSVHTLANAANTAAERLATALAAAGAPEEVVSQVTASADLFDKITEALGKGQEQTGDEEPAPDEEIPGAEPVTPTRPRTIQGAAEEMHNDMRGEAGVPRRAY
jgi:hypothetical protein